MRILPAIIYRLPAAKKMACSMLHHLDQSVRCDGNSVQATKDILFHKWPKKAIIVLGVSTPDCYGYFYDLGLDTDLVLPRPSTARAMQNLTTEASHE